MDWKEKILEGMKLIHEGCKEVEDWPTCQYCPFTHFCPTEYGDDSPSNWTDSDLKGEIDR